MKDIKTSAFKIADKIKKVIIGHKIRVVIIAAIIVIAYLLFEEE